MNICFDRFSCMERAKSLLAQNDDTVLRYVCLELRFCIEATAYNKLQLYRNRVPKKLFKKWQPPQLFKALIQLEPHAGENFKLAVSLGESSNNFTLLGENVTFDYRWLNKTYNKLGSFLHIPFEDTQKSILLTTELRKDLTGIIEKLDPIVESDIDAAPMAQCSAFNCKICGEQVWSSITVLENTEEVQCLNCDAEYSVLKDAESKFKFRLQAISFKCESCEKIIKIECRHLDFGYQFQCESCGTEYQIAAQKWIYEKIQKEQN